jgi:TonB family protein
MPDLPQIQELVNALGWTLVHFLWQGLAIAAAFWLVCRFTRSKNSLVRYWSGMVAFLASTVVPILTFGFYLNSPSSTESAQTFAAPIMPVSSDLSFSTLQLLSASMEPALPLVVILWAIGVAVLSARAMLGWIGAHRLVRLDTDEVSDSLKAVLNRLMASLEIQQAVQVLRSARVKVPTVVGWLKPVILLPIAVINRLPEDQLEMIIAHELGHIRRYDYLFNLLQVVVETLFFYHPAIRWMSRQVRQEREHCCDDLVIAQCDRPVLYARALANLEIMRDEPVPAISVAASGGDLIQRLHRIIRQDLPGKQSGLAQLAILLGVATLASVSAHQGMEVRNHFLDASSSANAPIVYEADTVARSRAAWVEGISGYSKLAADTAKVVVEEKLTTQNKAVESRIDSQGLALADQLLPVKVENVVMADPTNQGKQLFLPETPVMIETQSRGEDFAEEVALLLSSTSMPSKTKFDPELRSDHVQNDLEVQFEITPKTVVAPVYPFKARRKQINGFVRLEFSVDDSGRAKDIEVIEAQPAEVFEKSAISALEKWVFQVEENHEDDRRVYQIFDFDMEDQEPLLSKRERRCEIAGSRICGLKGYN